MMEDKAVKAREEALPRVEAFFKAAGLAPVKPCEDGACEPGCIWVGGDYHFAPVVGDDGAVLGWDAAVGVVYGGTYWEPPDYDIKMLAERVSLLDACKAVLDAHHANIANNAAEAWANAIAIDDEAALSVEYQREHSCEGCPCRGDDVAGDLAFDAARERGSGVRLGP